MKIPFNYSILLCAVLLFFAPAAAVTTGNVTGVHPTGTFQAPPHTAVPTPVPTFVPPINVSQNVGFIPLWLVIGIILIIIALGGLLWRYFHPKYVPPEDKE